jgi:predicted branched-subunit amino acid permease
MQQQILRPRQVPGRQLRVGRNPAADAVVDMVPALLGVLPLAVVVGVAAHEAALGVGFGTATSYLMFGGVANLAALDLAGSGASVAAVLAAVALVNARLAVYGAGLEPRFRDQPAWFRWLGPHTIVDQTYALATSARAGLDGPAFRRWWLACGAVLGGGFCAAVGAGIALGPVLPSHSALAIGGPACLVALLVPRLNDRPARAAATAAAASAVLAAPLQAAGLPLAVVAGLTAGALAERRGRR